MRLNQRNYETHVKRRLRRSEIQVIPLSLVHAHYVIKNAPKAILFSTFVVFLDFATYGAHFVSALGTRSVGDVLDRNCGSGQLSATD